MFYMLAKVQIVTSFNQFDIIAVQTLFMTFHQVSYFISSPKNKGLSTTKGEAWYLTN